MKDTRWIQRLSNFKKGLAQLEKAVHLANDRKLTDLEKQGLIQGFEYTHELAWKTLKDFIESRGNATLYGSKDATREAFQLGLISDGEGWMDMIKSRNESSHTYNEETANEIVTEVINRYYQLFRLLRDKMETLKSEDQNKR